MDGTCNAHGEMKNLCSISVGKPDEKGPLNRPRCKWKNNFKTEYKGTMCD